MYINKDVTPAVARRREVELTIIKATVKALLADGYSLGVNDGEELVLHHSTDTKAIYDALYNTDEDYLFVYVKGGDTKDKRPDYWVRFVYGNDGWDVINDYSVHLESSIGEGTRVQELIDKYCF